MSINAVSSQSPVAAQALQQQPPSASTKQVKNDSDGDADNSTAKIQKPEPPKPVLNTNGQTIGTIINTSA